MRSATERQACHAGDRHSMPQVSIAGNLLASSGNSLMMTEAMSDARVIERSLVDPAAFACIFDRHFDAIHCYLARRLGPDLADDLAGEVFRRAFEHRRRFDLAVLDAQPWLYGIATNLIRRHFRSETRRLRAHARANGRRELVDDPFAQLDDRLAAESVWPLLARALASLRPAERDVLMLYAWENFTYEDISLALSVPIGTVRSRLSRCRQRLRKLLGSAGQVPCDGPTRNSGEGA